MIKRIVAKHIVSEFLNKEVPNKLKDLLSLLYEAEYKYTKLKHDAPEEKGLLLEMSHKSKEIGSKISKQLEKVYADWLKGHAITNPKQWAEDRYEDTEEIGSTHEEEIESEFKRYAKFPFWSYQNKNLKDLKSLPNFKKWLGIVQDEFDKEGEPTPTLEFVLEVALDFSFKEYMELIRNWDISLYKKVVLEFYQIVFNVWYDHWKSQGIDKTRKRIEGVYQDLQEAPHQSISQMFKTINIALHESHQTGEMVDYIDREYGVSKRDLQNLSDKDRDTTYDWDQDLKFLLRKSSIKGITCSYWSPIKIEKSKGTAKLSHVRSPYGYNVFHIGGTETDLRGTPEVYVYDKNLDSYRGKIKYEILDVKPQQHSFYKGKVDGFGGQVVVYLDKNL